MSVPVTVNGLSYSFPSTGDLGWGNTVTAWAQAVSACVLPKSGGAFTLTGDVDFGGSKGLLAQYFSTRSSAATTGVLRLANLDTVAWLNNAGSGNNTLRSNSSDQLVYNAVAVAQVTGASPAVLTLGFISTTNDTTTRYSVPGGPAIAAGTTEYAIPVPCAGTIKNLRIYATAAPLDSCTFVVRKGGSNQTLTAVMTNGTTTASDTTHSFTVVAGDRISVSHTMASATTGPSGCCVAMQLTQA